MLRWDRGASVVKAAKRATIDVCGYNVLVGVARRVGQTMALPLRYSRRDSVVGLEVPALRHDAVLLEALLSRQDKVKSQETMSSNLY